MTRSRASSVRLPSRAPRRVASVVAVLGAVAALVTSAPTRAEAPRDVTPQVVFVGPEREVPVLLEVRRTPRQLQVGYMYRLFVPPGTGMLFIMQHERLQGFWMKNTVAPLDMIFVNDAREVVGIVHRVPPLTHELRWVKRPSRFVIEVAGGYAKAVGIRPGDRVRFVGVPGL